MTLELFPVAHQPKRAVRNPANLREENPSDPRNGPMNFIRRLARTFFAPGGRLTCLRAFVHPPRPSLSQDRGISCAAPTRVFAAPSKRHQPIDRFQWAGSNPGRSPRTPANRVPQSRRPALRIPAPYASLRWPKRSHPARFAAASATFPRRIPARSPNHVAPPDFRDTVSPAVHWRFARLRVLFFV